MCLSYQKKKSFIWDLRNNENAETSGFYQTEQTTFSVGLGLYIHKKTRSKELIDSLSQMHLCINYQKVSPSVQTSYQIFFAVDNSDFKNDTCDGKDEFHGIITTVYQPSRDNANTLQLEINPHEKSCLLKHFPLVERTFCAKPNPPNRIYPLFNENLILPIEHTHYLMKTMRDAYNMVLFLTFYGSYVKHLALDQILCQLGQHLIQFCLTILQWLT